MSKHFKKIISLVLVSTMMFNMTGLTARADMPETNGNYSSSEERVDDFTIDTYIINNQMKQVDVVRSVKQSDGNYSYYGWHNIGANKNFVNKTCDFMTTVVNGNVMYAAKGNPARVVATINNGNVVIDGSTKDVFPTKWMKDDPEYGDVLSDTSDVADLVSILAAAVGYGGTSLFTSLANYIISHNSPSVYYEQTRYYRAYDACTQQYYYSTKWYSEPNYTGYIKTTKSSTYEDYLCR